jgi:uncharacterized membrane protein YhaH (DUF805 family)
MTEGTMGVTEDPYDAQATTARPGIVEWLSPRGRLPRAAYWARYAAPILLLEAGAVLVDRWLTPGTLEVLPARHLMALVLAWPAVAGTLKRMHDLAYSAWTLTVVVIGVPIAVAVAKVVPSLGPAGLVLGVPALTLALGALWVTVRVAAARGTVGPNRHGPDPLEEDWLDRAR